MATIEWERLKAYSPDGLHAYERRIDQDIDNELHSRRQQLIERKKRKQKRAKRRRSRR